MGCLKTDNCCCCFSLRTGGLILGWLGVIGSALGVIAGLTMKGQQKYYHPVYINGQDYAPEMHLIRNIITFIVCGLLLYGIYNKRSPFLLPQVALTVVGFFGSLIWIGFIIFGGIVAISSKDKEVQAIGYALLAMLLFVVPALALAWHFTAVIYSLYQQIKEEQDRHPGVAYHVGGQRDPYKV